MKQCLRWLKEKILKCCKWFQDDISSQEASQWEKYPGSLIDHSPAPLAYLRLWNKGLDGFDRALNRRSPWTICGNYIDAHIAFARHGGCDRVYP